MSDDMMRQEAPRPDALYEVVQQLHLQPGYTAELLDDYDRGQGSKGLTLCISVMCEDAYNTQVLRTVLHLFIVPAAAYDYRSWRRWVFQRYLDVLTHEAMEWFLVGTDRPYAPNHGPGRDPYVVHEVGTDQDRRTSNQGVVKP